MGCITGHLLFSTSTGLPVVAFAIAPSIHTTGCLPNTSSWLACADTASGRYILPSLSLVPQDGEASVRQAYASIVVPMAKAANRFLVHLQLAAVSEQTYAPDAPAAVSPCSFCSALHSRAACAPVGALASGCCTSVSILCSTWSCTSQAAAVMALQLTYLVCAGWSVEVHCRELLILRRVEGVLGLSHIL